MNNFAELSGCVFSWLEEKCKPQMLQDLMFEVLNDVRLSYQQMEAASEHSERLMNAGNPNGRILDGSKK